ncbi:MAG TPA: CapA family protein [Waterburya sp.]|jgi:poly-gamma-glutamate capsule biosynthesis protein CapA/YwtB (metallophosphatase superfamily)
MKPTFGSTFDFSRLSQARITIFSGVWMLSSRLRYIKRFLSRHLSRLLLSQQENYTLFSKRDDPKTMALFYQKIRHRSALLVFIGICSFLLGIGYGFTQKYSHNIAYTEVEDYAEIEAIPNLPSNIKSPKALPKVNIKIKAVGDIVPGTNYPNNRLSPEKKILFQSVKSLLTNADFLFGNFESTLTNYPFSTKGLGGGLVVPFRTPPSYTQILKEAGFDIMSVANNHSFDFSVQGFQDTIQNLENAGIKALGKKGQILIAHYKDLSIAWIGFSFLDYHNSINHLDQAKALVQKAHKKADIVVISFHGGAEGTNALRVRNQTEIFANENRGNLVKFAHTMIDNGADLILGHSPHVPRALELYKGKLIAYSLGNFMGYRTLVTEAELGYSLVLEVELNNQGDFIMGKIIPVHLNRQGIPYPDRQGRSIKLIRQLTQLDFPKTPLTIKNDGKILRK